MSHSTEPRWTRRALLEAALSAGIGAMAPGRSRGGQLSAAEALMKRPLITKRIPKTGERIPAIGTGTNAFKSDLYEDVRAVLQRMYELGGTVIDTSSDYPNPSISDDSEVVIGRALAELHIRNKMFLATKFNAEGFQSEGTPRDNLFGQAAVDRSLQRLQGRNIDLMYVHHAPSIDPLMPLLQELKRAGKARYIGFTTERLSEHAFVMEKMRQYPIDVVQVDYSLGNREAASTVLPLALERHIAVTVDIPLGGRRGSLMQEVADRPLPSWASDIDVTSWSQFFLKYVISHPAVTCAIPGSTKVEHLVDNQLAARGRLPDAMMRKKMEDYWDHKS